MNFVNYLNTTSLTGQNKFFCLYRVRTKIPSTHKANDNNTYVLVSSIEESYESSKRFIRKLPEHYIFSIRGTVTRLWAG